MRIFLSLLLTSTCYIHATYAFWNSTTISPATPTTDTRQLCAVFNVNAEYHGAWELINLPANETCPRRWDGISLSKWGRTTTKWLHTTINGHASEFPILDYAILRDISSTAWAGGLGLRILPVTTNYAESYPACVDVMPEQTPPPSLMAAWRQDRCPCPTKRCEAGCDYPLDTVQASTYRAMSCVQTRSGTSEVLSHRQRYLDDVFGAPINASMCLSNLKALVYPKPAEPIGSAITCYKRSVYETTYPPSLSTCNGIVYAGADSPQRGSVLTTMLTTLAQARRLVDPCFQLEACGDPVADCACKYMPAAELFDVCKMVSSVFTSPRHRAELEIMTGCVLAPQDLKAWHYTCMYYGSAELSYVEPKTKYPKDMCALQPDNARLSAFYKSYYMDLPAEQLSYVNDTQHITMFADKAYMNIKELYIMTRGPQCSNWEQDFSCYNPPSLLASGTTELTMNWTDVYTIRDTPDGPKSQMMNIADLQEPQAWSALNDQRWHQIASPLGEPVYRRRYIHPYWLAFPKNFEAHFPQLKGCLPAPWGIADPNHGYDPSPRAGRPKAPGWANPVLTSLPASETVVIGIQAMPHSTAVSPFPAQTASSERPPPEHASQSVQASAQLASSEPRPDNGASAISDRTAPVQTVSTVVVADSLTIRFGSSSVMDTKGTTYSLGAKGLTIIKNNGVETVIPQKVLAAVGVIEGVEGVVDAGSAMSPVILDAPALRLIEQQRVPGLGAPTQAEGWPQNARDGDMPANTGRISPSRAGRDSADIDRPSRIVGGAAPGATGSFTTDEAEEDAQTAAAARLATTATLTGNAGSRSTWADHTTSSTKKSQAWILHLDWSLSALALLLALAVLL